MDIINGLAPKENLIAKGMIGAFSRKIINQIGVQAYQKKEDKMVADAGADWLAQEGCLDNPLL